MILSESEPIKAHFRFLVTGGARHGGPERIHHRTRGQQLGQGDAGGGSGSVDQVDRHAVAAEALQVGGDPKLYETETLVGIVPFDDGLDRRAGLALRTAAR